jgi:acetyl esterase/lipase
MESVMPFHPFVRNLSWIACAFIAGTLGAALAVAQQTDANPDTTTLDADGTAHITRVIGVPTTLSPEAQAFLKTGKAWAPAAGSPESVKLIERAKEVYPVDIEDGSLGGVPVKIVKPRAQGQWNDRQGCVVESPGKNSKVTVKRIPCSVLVDMNKTRVFLCIHGGGFVSDSGSMIESIPIASLTHTKVVAVDYRLAPKYVFPAPVDDVVAVYRELLKTYKPASIGVYGTSAGAILTAMSTVRFRQLGLPLPAALGFFSGMADFSRIGDSTYYFGVPGLDGARVPGDPGKMPFLAGKDLKDPAISPIYADLHGFPPTLCMTGTRDMLLSGTANFHRALLLAGVETQLVVYDAMPHAHWYMIEIPEAKEALEVQARFLELHVPR